MMFFGAGDCIVPLTTLEVLHCCLRLSLRKAKSLSRLVHLLILLVLRAFGFYHLPGFLLFCGRHPAFARMTCISENLHGRHDFIVASYAVGRA